MPDAGCATDGEGSVFDRTARASNRAGGFRIPMGERCTVEALWAQVGRAAAVAVLDAVTAKKACVALG